MQCVRGAIFDVAADLRPGSPTFGRAVWAELSAENGRMFFVPEGFAHGFLTLADDSDVFYYMGSAYVPGAAAGIRYDDPQLAIPWPASPQVISERDAAFDYLLAGSAAGPARLDDRHED